MSRINIFKKMIEAQREIHWQNKICSLQLYADSPRPFIEGCFCLPDSLDKVYDDSCSTLYKLMKRKGIRADVLKEIYLCYHEIYKMVRMNARFQERAEGLSEEEKNSGPVRAAFSDIEETAQDLTEHIHMVSQMVGTETVIPENLKWFQKEHELNLKKKKVQPMLPPPAPEVLAIEEDTGHLHLLAKEIKDARVKREAGSCLDKAETFLALAKSYPPAAVSERRVWNYLLPETDTLLEKIMAMQKNEDVESEKKGLFYEQAVEELRLLGKAFAVRTERVKKQKANNIEDLSSDIHVLKQVMAMDGDIIKEEGR